MSGRQQRVMVQPINVIFKNLQQKSKIVIWLYDNIEMRIEGESFRACRGRAHPLNLLRVSAPRICSLIHARFRQGFDEFMNVVIDEAAEVYVKDAKPRRELGRILLKGDNITLIQQVV
ncbi:Sm-like ribonucleoprotein [Mycena leptocephala]|nr:Sm-like ribonucleoprotein [Mycena leptocephala]